MITLPRTAMGVFALTLRLLLGALFIYTGWMKAADPGAFLLSVRSFQLVQDPYAAWIAMGLPWLEILAGAALVTGLCIEGGLAVIAGMLAAFLWALVYSWQRGLDVDCGCFGKEETTFSYGRRIAQDIALLAVAVGLLVHRWIQLRRRASLASRPAR